MISFFLKLLFPFLRGIFFGRPEEEAKYTEAERRRARIRFLFTMMLLIASMMLLYRVGDISIAYIKLKRENQQLRKDTIELTHLKEQVEVEKSKVALLRDIVKTCLRQNPDLAQRASKPKASQ